MDEYISKKHTKEREFKGFGGHATLILMADISLQMSLHSHSTVQSSTLQKYNNLHSCPIEANKISTVLKSEYQIRIEMMVLIKDSYTLLEANPSR